MRFETLKCVFDSCVPLFTVYASEKIVWKWDGRPCILSLMRPCMAFKISSRGENHQNAPNDLWPTFGNISFIECGVIKCYQVIWLEMQKSITNAVDNDISSHVQVEKESETPSLWKSSVERLLIVALQWSVCWCNWLLYFTSTLIVLSHNDRGVQALNIPSQTTMNRREWAL